MLSIKLLRAHLNCSRTAMPVNVRGKIVDVQRGLSLSKADLRQAQASSIFNALSTKTPRTLPVNVP